jgi:hypothetical protein
VYKTLDLAFSNSQKYLTFSDTGAITSTKVCERPIHHAQVLASLVALHGGHVHGLLSATKPRTKKESEQTIPGTIYKRGNAPLVYVGGENPRAKREASKWCLMDSDYVYVDEKESNTDSDVG